MKEKELVPKRRFKEFQNTDAWEQRKLSEVMSDFIVPMRDKPKEFSGDIPWTRIEDIEGKYLKSSLSGQCVSEETIKKMNLKIIPKGSLIVSASATFGVVAVVTQDLITNQTFIGLVPEGDFNLDFLYTFFQSPTVQKKMKLESAGSTIFYISRQSFEDMKFLFPDYAEQQKVGEFFNDFDNLITLHQRKLEKTKALKSAYLAEMFPVEGERVPKRRFSGFIEEWQVQILGDIVEVIGTGKSSFVTNDNSNENRYAILGSTSVIGYDSVYDYSGDFILTARVGANAGNLYKYSGKVKISDNTVFIKSDNLEFLFFLLEKINLKNLSFGTGQPLIKASELNNLKILIPNKNEQQAIGKFFKKLDDSIRNQQQKLNKLKAMKQAYLEEMFV